MSVYAKIYLLVICCLVSVPAMAQEAEEMPEPIDTIKGENGLMFIRYEAGKGDKHPENGDKVTVSYVGMLEDGTVFDDSQNYGPFTFKVGKGKVIPGWEKGVQLMKKGDSGILIVPSDLGYGEKGFDDRQNPEQSIPPNATLIFEMTLLDF